MSNRAVIYLRSSKDRGDVSIDVQRRALHDLATARNLVVVDEFADAVESGKDEDRPAFQRLIAALKSHARPWELVLVLDTSRVARRRLIAMIFEQECAKRGVKLVYRNLPESDPATDMVLRSVLQAFDEYHSLVSRAKGLAGMAENVRQGWRAGGRAPRGYRLEYHPTGAIRDGAPVLKPRLALDEDTAPLVRAYLELRARGTARGVAIARLRLPWPTSSTHSMDWQALTYAGHTVWNMHAERAGGRSMNGEKRRPRAEWVVRRDTHPALIDDDQAEAILGQMERALQGRRLRESPLLLTGLLVTPDGAPWHSDGCGFYRLGKGRKVAAGRVDAVVLRLLTDDYASDAAVQRVLASLRQLADAPTVDGRTLAGMERRIATLTEQIGKTVDLAALMPDPTPVLRRVADLEQQRAMVADQLAASRAQQAHHRNAQAIDESQVRALLRRLFGDIAATAGDNERRPDARRALRDVIDRVELDAAASSLRVHYCVHTGDKVASPRAAELSPAAWASEYAPLPRRRSA